MDYKHILNLKFKIFKNNKSILMLIDKGVGERKALLQKRTPTNRKNYTVRKITSL